jgi:hypothetical protein
LTGKQAAAVFYSIDDSLTKDYEDKVGFLCTSLPEKVAALKEAP